MATPACAPSPCWALPLLDDASNGRDGAMALRAEQRLLALRRKMEEGEHKYNEGLVLPPPPSLGFGDDSPRSTLRTPSSLPFAPLTAGDRRASGLRTPRVTLERSAPLETPPTPGRKRRFLGSGAGDSGCPSFLPLGAVAQEKENQKRWPPVDSIPPRTSSGDGKKKRDGPNAEGKRFRVSPRYDSPWLAGYTVATPPLASVEVRRSAEVVPEPQPKPQPQPPKTVEEAPRRPVAGGPKSVDPGRAARDAALLGKLQAIAEMMDISSETSASQRHETIGETTASPWHRAPPSSGLRGSLSGSLSGSLLARLSLSPNQRPNEVRAARAASMSHGLGGNYGPPKHSERLGKFVLGSPPPTSAARPAVRSLSLNMLRSDFSRSRSDPVKPSSLCPGSSPLLAKAAFDESFSFGAEGGKLGGGSTTVAIGDLPERQECVFRATLA